MLNLCTAWKELGRYKGRVGVTTAFINPIELVYPNNKADTAQRWTPAFQLNPWETGGWQGHWESALQGCKSTGRGLELKPRSLRWIRGTVVKQLLEICQSLQKEKCGTAGTDQLAPEELALVTC